MLEEDDEVKFQFSPQSRMIDAVVLSSHHDPSQPDLYCVVVVVELTVNISRVQLSIHTNWQHICTVRGNAITSIF